MIPVPGRGYGFVSFVGQRRHRKQQMEMVRKTHEDQVLRNQFKRQEIENALERAEEKGFPQEIVDLLRLQMGDLMAPELPDIPPDKDLEQQELEQLSEQFIGSYLEKLPNGGWKAWDFRTLLMSASSAEYIPGFESMSSGTKKHNPAAVYVSLPSGDEITMENDVAIAFVRYLHYLGLFRVEKAKRPCPNCGAKEPQDCETCGGIGWVLEGHGGTA